MHEGRRSLEREMRARRRLLRHCLRRHVRTPCRRGIRPTHPARATFHARDSIGQTLRRGRPRGPDALRSRDMSQPGASSPGSQRSSRDAQDASSLGIPSSSPAHVHAPAPRFTSSSSAGGSPLHFPTSSPGASLRSQRTPTARRAHDGFATSSHSGDSEPLFFPPYVRAKLPQIDQLHAAAQPARRHPLVRQRALALAAPHAPAHFKQWHRDAACLAGERGAALFARKLRGRRDGLVGWPRAEGHLGHERLCR